MDSTHGVGLAECPPLQAVNETDHVGIMKSKVCRWKESVFSGNYNLGVSHEAAV
jgi:hypothetical protein